MHIQAHIRTHDYGSFRGDTEGIKVVGLRLWVIGQVVQRDTQGPNVDMGHRVQAERDTKGC